MKKIVFLDRDTFPKRLRLKKPDFKHSWKNYSTTNKKDIPKRIKNANIIVVNKVILTRKDLKIAKNLELIALSATGTNIIDLDYCRKNNIKVCNLRNYASDAVAEHVFTLMLNLVKQIKGLEKDVAGDVWQKKKVFALLNRKIFNLNNKKLGIIGKGSIGLKVSKIAKAFNMEVSFISARKLKNNELEKFLSKQDVVSLHCPLEKNTKNLIGLKELNSMKNSAIIINTARGGIINEDSLVKAIKSKIIAGAGIDVSTTEPPRKNHPYYKINKKTNFIWTPHTAWAADETLTFALEQLIENINSNYFGKAKNLV
mgnify:CR=1 FL=1|tara:strand:- start:1807 stop:2745 length:939 start_codon:yes stop_codon:yes gene_type:complete